MPYIKRGALLALLLFFLISVSIAFAQHSATISLSYNPVYETRNASFLLNVANERNSSNSILNVSLVHNGFNLLSAENPSGWSSYNSSNETVLGWVVSASFYDWWLQYFNLINLGISSDGIQNFRFSAAAGIVDNDTNYTWTLSTTDYAGEVQVNQISVLVLNDPTGPLLSNAVPDNGSFVKNITTLFSINVIDSETDVESVSLNHGFCDNITNSVSLNKSNDTYFNNVDLSIYPDASPICYAFNAINFGGEQSSYNGIIIVDGIAPSISLISPNDGIRLNNVNLRFEINATDNLAQNLNCSLVLNNQSVYSFLAARDEITAFDYTVPADGNYSWYVSCLDLAGWQGISETRSFFLDLYGPNITINSIGDVARGSTAIINATITDFSGVDSVSGTITDPDGNSESLTFTRTNDNYVAQYPTSLNSTLGIYTITINANDSLGNPSNATEQFELIYSYIIILTLPSSVNVNQPITASGNVKFDNGNLVPEQEITLILPSGSVNVLIDNMTGDFNYTFNAPSSAGTYNVTASITAQNNRTYSETKQFNVNEPSRRRSGGGGGRSRSTPIITVDRNAGLLYQECRKDSDCGEGKECNNGKCVGQPTPAREVLEIVEDRNAGILEQTNETENISTAPIGMAAGWFSLERLNVKYLWWIFIALLVLLGIMKIARRKRRPNLGLDSYLEKRRRFE